MKINYKQIIKDYVTTLKWSFGIVLFLYLFVLSIGYDECINVSRKNNLEFTFTLYYDNACYFKRENVLTTLAQEQDMLKEKK